MSLPAEQRNHSNKGWASYKPTTAAAMTHPPGTKNMHNHYRHGYTIYNDYICHPHCYQLNFRHPRGNHS